MHCSNIMSSFCMLLHQQGWVTKCEGTGLEQVRNAFKHSMGLRFFFRYLSGKNLETLRSKESIIICLFAYFCRKRMISVAIVRQNVSKLSPKDCITLRHRVNSWEKLSDPSTKLPERTSVRIILGPFKGKEKRKKRQNFLTFDGPRNVLLHICLRKMSHHVRPPFWKIALWQRKRDWADYRSVTRPEKCRPSKGQA